MDVVGSEIGHKMRSAIKAKLTELGCYVDDELPDYVMVMVANKRTRSQMEDDLQLFLGDNTELFVNWLHQVLKKLQEVTVATPLKSVESEKVKERSISKERKLKDKKEKSKKSDGSKKSKKKAKEKSHKKKEEKKKSKKKKKHEMIRPNIPPLLMNIEKESEPSITDVFAGQILKNHGIILDTHKDEPKVVEQKPIVTETKRPIVPIIDPASIPSQTSSSDVEEFNTQSTEPDTLASSESVVTSKSNETIITKKSLTAATSKTDDTNNSSKTNDTVVEKTDNESREEKLKEMNEIEAKIQGLKQKLADQLENNDSVSDDEDFLNIRTEADELINDFAEDVFQEISQAPPIVTPPLRSRKSRSPSPPPPVNNVKKTVPKDIPETLPQIELNLPKRPIRERLGAPIQKTDPVIEKNKDVKATESAEKTPERLTPEKEPEPRSQKSAKSRLGNPPQKTEHQRKRSTPDKSAKLENNSKRLTSRVSVLENRPSRMTCASVVRVRPRPRGPAPASSLLLRAVADAHKSLLNIPPKVDPEPQKVKRALVLPMRRAVDPKKIVIQVPCTEASANNSDSISDNVSLGDLDSGSEEKSPLMSREGTGKDEYSPKGITKVVKNTEYVPSRTLIRRDDALFVETINIHNTTVDKDKDTQFIVTMDGYHPNAFLAKKLMTEGLLNDEEEISNHNKGDKAETIKKGTQGLLKNNNKGTKDIASRLDGKTNTTITVSTNNMQNEEADKSNDHSKEESSKLVLDVSDNSKDDLGTEKRKIVEEKKKETEKRKSDSASENLTVGKRIRETSVEKPIEETKTHEIVENTAPEKRKSEVSLVKPIVEKKIMSVDKPVLEKRKSDVSLESSTSEDEKTTPPTRKRKASPIVFDVHKKEKVVEKKERTTSSSSDGHVVLTTASNTHKYDTVPPLSQASKPVWCRAFPACRYGSSCAFAHPRCKFAAACTRRGCVYSHAANALTPPALASAPVVASHVVPAANYKSISAGAFANLCKFYPGCSNPACHYYHPKPCRYGKACTNKLECNFYHHDVAGGKWKYSV